VKRSVALLAVMTLAAFLAVTPAADAVGTGACSISGTIRFTPSPTTPDHGAWNIEPAVIQCRGVFNLFGAPASGIGFGEHMTGVGQPFIGFGSYTTVPGTKGCLHELGNGTVEYFLQTDWQDVHMQEPNSFRLAGVGSFTTPTLYGSFQIPLHESNCVSEPATTALFLAEVTMVRTTGTSP
jgi:hypothetical protein